MFTYSNTTNTNTTNTANTKRKHCCHGSTANIITFKKSDAEFHINGSLKHSIKRVPKSRYE